ncbi:hypothetical protein BCV71DRAFT_171593 [Rhizopus microsporus]|uniref:Uncharacterized protein n=1 Tax=Rhizopus microsporus TaxID=58291 RepID=A0A1X0SEG0_RHIZD|nr:hypothetical protein BCV71DRAFT_171593 [Rhizopus microsporus]
MYSPRRNPVIRTPERNTISPSPLRALTPFVDAIKSAQTKATKDFESFYGSLMSKLTPKTSTSRIIKKTPETTERTKSFLKQKKIEQEYNRTSLTPLFERHTLREDYPSLNPFYEETESEITDDQTELDNNSIMNNNNNKKSVNYYSPDTKKLDTSRSVNKTNTTPNTNDLLHEISTAKLKSAEIIR